MHGPTGIIWANLTPFSLKCFARIESEVNDSYHIMISYRVASEKEFALELYEILSKQVLTATGQRLRVFLDQVCLKDGERWGES